jgi:Cft2 family RNA processing exonuclease
MKKIGEDIFFTSKFPLRMDLKSLNIMNISQIDVVFVSTFRECYGLPYLIQSNQFKGKIYMTQAMAQIGRSLLIEFVKMCEERNANSIQYINQSK